MIDIETLGLMPESVICSIGAVSFIPSHQDPYLDAFYLECDINQLRGIDTDTLKWWNKQTIPLPIYGTQTLQSVLLDLNNWFKEQGKDVEIWANGTDFDVSVLYNAYRQYNLAPPWKYNDVRDYRTMSKMFPHIARPPKAQDAHNALVDAKMQATHLSAILVHLNGMIETWEKNV